MTASSSDISKFSPTSTKTKLSRILSAKRYRKRIIRYGLLVGNLTVVIVAVLLVLHNHNSPSTHSVIKDSDTQATNPLDPISAADIAVSAARMANLAEATSVTNQADSVAADLSTHVVDYAVVTKPQILSSVIKTKADIKDYTVQDGDTLASLASKFGITSDSIKWSNSLTGNTLKVGTNLIIPPIDGIAYVVKDGDTPDSLASKYSASKDQIIVFNDAEVTGIKTGEKIVIPGGSIAPPAPVYTAGFSFGAAAVYGSNGYDYGWCTYYVAAQRIIRGNPVPSNLGNAYSWYTVAQRVGLPTGTTPAVGAVMVVYFGPSSPANHVSIVEQVNDDGSFWVSEMNASGQVSIEDSRGAGGWARVDFHFYPSAGYSKFIY